MTYLISSAEKSYFEMRLEEAKERGDVVLQVGKVRKYHSYVVYWARVRGRGNYDEMGQAGTTG